jgi:hypothetical protein
MAGAVIFWDEKRVVGVTSSPRGITVYPFSYTETLWSVIACSWGVHPTRKKSHVLFPHDNARLCTVVLTTEAITKFGWRVARPMLQFWSYSSRILSVYSFERQNARMLLWGCQGTVECRDQGLQRKESKFCCVVINASVQKWKKIDGKDGDCAEK